MFCVNPGAVNPGQQGTKVAAHDCAAPRIVVAEKHHDFGTVEQGEEVQHVFKVRNEGKGVLHIKRVRGS